MVGRIFHADSRESNMKQILWLASWYPDEKSPYNGDFIQRHARAVAAHHPITVVYMSQHGPEVEIPSTTALTEKDGALTEIRVYFRYTPTGIRWLDKVRYNWKYFRHYQKFIRHYIHGQGKPELIHVHIPMKAGRVALWIQKEFKIPYIISEHSSAYSSEVPDDFQKRSGYYRKWVRQIFGDALAATTVSARLGNRLTELFAIRDMHIIPNVADTSHFRYAPEAPPRFRFLHASTMDHPKNVEGMLRTFQQLLRIRKDWECLMLGWDTPELRSLAGSLGLDGHITWKGVVSYQSVAAHMRQSSAFIMFSRYENQPCVILEALCCGIPVIATAVGGIPEVVNASNGMLVEPGNESQLLAAMQQCLEHPERFDGEAIAQQAKELFSYDVVGKQFTDLYRRYQSTMKQG